MNTTSHEPNVVPMPAELLAEARRATNEEHRPLDELVRDAVRHYLQFAASQECRSPTAQGEASQA